MNVCVCVCACFIAATQTLIRTEYACTISVRRNTHHVREHTHTHTYVREDHPDILLHATHATHATALVDLRYG